MFDELRNASNQLEEALDRYVRICSSIRDLCFQGLGTAPQDIISHHIEQVEKELGLAEKYDAKIQLAKTAIKVTRNYAFKSTSIINHLPDELLNRIFHMTFAVDSQSAVCVALVCSRWRSVALRDPSLWSSVDLYPNFSKWFYPTLGCANLHISRSGSLPLDIYILSPDTKNGKYCDYLMKDVCRLAAPRMKSLCLDWEGFGRDELRASRHVALTKLFSGCSPGMFTKLVTRSDDFCFFGPKHQPTSMHWGINLGMEESQFEAVFTPVTILNLTGLYPPWTSRAYHGLVELRLVASMTDSNDSIRESELINILRSSPELRVLKIGLQVTNRAGESSGILVSLPNLQVLELDVIGASGGAYYLGLVHFLTLGRRPLDLTVYCYEQQLTRLSEGRTKAFLLRSNITRFRADEIPNPFEYLPLMPHLKVLILTDGFGSPTTSRVTDVIESPASDQRESSFITYPKLEICVVLRYSLSLDEFRSIMQQCQIQTLIIHASKFHRGTDRQMVALEVVKGELLGICSDVVITETIPEFVEHGNFFLDIGEL
ncbi:unnamed protein product [Rhizoctonia solani]|uniref:F-box domain-containing protein n=1 Tax=Rhizoctonia solani TaxID=456999 RepID=A0A8H3E733_9AGAM|nr:unnamed protein product [Rhizoctonia solani]